MAVENPTPQENPKIRIIVTPKLEVVGETGEGLQALYGPDLSLDPKEKYDYTTYPLLKGINAEIEKMKKPGRVTRITQGKVFDLTFEPERTAEEALLHTEETLKKAKADPKIESDLFSNSVIESISEIRILSDSSQTPMIKDQG
jgi:hypothetical protein